MLIIQYSRTDASNGKPRWTPGILLIYAVDCIKKTTIKLHGYITTSATSYVDLLHPGKGIKLGDGPGGKEGFTGKGS